MTLYFSSVAKAKAKKFPVPFDFTSDIKHLLPHIHIAECGSDKHPYSINWCKALHEGIKELENIAIMDYGCGYGRFLNYMLKNETKIFKYYGFELRGRRGICLNDFNKNYLYLNDENKFIKFGFGDEQNLIDEAIQNCNVILLGSVFTHWIIEDSVEFLKTFDEIIKKGKAIFSLIMKPVYYYYGDMAYGEMGTYNMVTHTPKQLEMLTLDGKYKIQEMSTFDTPHNCRHTIFSLIYANQQSF